MAIYKEAYRSAGTNSSPLGANHAWATALRVRMSDSDRYKYGACNMLRIVNTSSSADATLSFTWDVARTNSMRIRANSIINITPEDGKNFYGFDLYSADASTAINTSEVIYTMARIEQRPER